jgi:putative addiction module component (TIGR02574 family)
MSADAQRILDEALKLPDQDRAAIAMRLLDSVGESADEIENAWLQEARARLADIERGSVQTAPWTEARERIFAR